MKKVFHIFKIRKEERWLSILLLLLLAILNGLVISKYYAPFTEITGNYYKNFIRHFCVSGFDPLTYWVLSDWNAAYNVYRHPLLAFYMYVPYLINMGLMKLTGYNCALFIAVAIQLFCAFYSMIFIHRIFRDVVELGKTTAHVLTFLFFSFGYVMVTSIVPDHFVISMMLLILALYVSGRRMKNHHQFKIWQSVLYFLLTAGTSLNNGIKIFFSALFVNGKRFFRSKHLLLAVILPAGLLWGFCRWEYRVFVWPNEMARKEAKAKKIAESSKTHHIQKANQQAKKGAKRKKVSKMGKPMLNVGFMKWTDATTGRGESIVENLMGESIQLHQDYLLGDELRHRPMIVNYRHWWNYAVEGAIAVLFLAGIWIGRKSKFLWLVMSYFALDMLLHIGLGFGINEVYIMTAHWIYALPIAIAFLMKGINEKYGKRYGKYLVGIVGALALYLLLYNGGLIVSYFT